VDVPGLWHAAARFWSVREVITLDDQHFIEVVAKDACCDQTCEAGADRTARRAVSITSAHDG
jgi:hypothetical protein